MSGGGDDRGFLWRADNPSSCAELAGHSDSVSCAAFSEDGALVATGGMDGRVLVWDASTGARKVRTGHALLAVTRYHLESRLATRKPTHIL